MTIIKPEANPFCLEGDKEAALLFIHGFTASPSEVYPTAEIIHQLSNYTVSSILLPGHGLLNPEDLNRTGWQDWFAAVEKELSLLKENYDKVYVGGLSMGGLLALHAGVHVSGLRGMVSINAPIFLKMPFARAMAPVVQQFKPCVPKIITKPLYRLKEEGRMAYDCIPLKAFRSMMELRNILLEEVDEINIPLLLMQSRFDESVSIKSAAYIMKRVNKSSVRLVDLNRSQHVATMGIEKETIAREMVNFMKNY